MSGKHHHRSQPRALPDGTFPPLVFQKERAADPKKDGTSIPSSSKETSGDKQPEEKVKADQPQLK